MRAEGEAISSYTHNTNNELLTITSSLQPIAFSYDANGNTTQETDGGNITNYIYNSSDRLERVELPGGGIAIYTYDPFGRRIKKDVNGQVTYYLYADEGLIGEYDSAGNLQKSYGWTPESPLGRGAGVGSIWGTNPVFMEQGGSYYYYHNDHLGTPQKMTDEGGNVVWQATYTVFGEAMVGVAIVTNNLRFPGQYYDAETGKHYNNQRYYDPKVGRYISEDPIGLAGGDTNLYRYAKNSPLMRRDPSGLITLCEAADFVDSFVNGRIGAFVFAVIDVKTGLEEIALGQSLMVLGGLSEVGTGAISTPVSLPTAIAGVVMTTVGVVSTTEGVVHGIGALLGNEELMNYDALGNIGIAKDTIDTLAFLRRPYGGGAKIALRKLAEALRNLNDLFKANGKCSDVEKDCEKK